MLTLALVVLVLAFAPPGRAATTVDCKQGDDLQVAIDAAAAGATLTVKGTCLGTFTIDKDLTLEGMGKATLDGDGAGPVLTVEATTTAVLEDLTITGGEGTTIPLGEGFFIATGGIYSEGDLTLRSTEVTANSAEATGEGAFVAAVGGVWNAGDGGLTLIESEVSANTANTAGFALLSAIGGIRNSTLDGTGAGTLALRQSAVSGNSASASGTGAPFVAAIGGVQTAGDTVVEEGTVSGNTATSSGTGFVVTAGGMEVASIFLSPTSTEATLDMVTVIGNSAESTGTTAGDIVAATGGLVNFGALVTLRQSTIGSNDAGAAGLGITTAVGGSKTAPIPLTPAPATSFDESTVRGNSATADAGDSGLAVGGVLNGDPGSLEPAPVTTLTESAVTMNRANPRGGTATGGLHDLFDGDGVTLTESQAQKNRPTNCNFPDPACATP